MVKASLPSFRSFTLLALAFAIVSPAIGRSADKKAQKEAEIKALEEKIHQLPEKEKAALKKIDARYDHIIRNMDPKEIHNQLEEILGVLHQLKDLLSLHDNGSDDHLNYNHDRAKAAKSIERADHQVEKALHHDTAEERARAAHDIGAVHEDLSKALAFSQAHPAAVDGKSKEEMERRAVENQHLTDALPKVEMAHHLLMAVDHEISDYKAEKAELHKKREAEKKETKAKFEAKRKELEKKLNALKK